MPAYSVKPKNWSGRGT